MYRLCYIGTADIPPNNCPGGEGAQNKTRKCNVHVACP